MDNNEFLSFILKDAYILIPVLLILGRLLKDTPAFSDWLIPYFLLVIGIIFSVAILGFDVQAIIQGILVTGAAVFGHQLLKQYKEKDDRNV